MAKKFSIKAEYTLALLQLLVIEGPLPTPTAKVLFEKKYGERIPEEMYGMVGNEIKWWNRVRWERLNLARIGFIGNEKRGIWNITDKGQKFLSEHPNDALLQLQTLMSLDTERAKEERQMKAVMYGMKPVNPSEKKPAKRTIRPKGK